MASTYSTNLKIELQATGENSGTWGTITNTNLGTALEQAIVGYGNPSYASDANLTLTYTDTNAAQAARALVLNVTSAVSLTATRELVVPTIQKQYIVQNNTTGSQSITVKTSAGTGITVPNGRKAHLYVDGTNVIYMDDYVDINGGAIDGTPIGASSASTGAFTTLSASGNFTLSGGTANGVLYLNGSKVATSGSALTYDGTTFTSGAHTLSTGNLTFSSTAQRITGDMSNATLSNRLAFQTSTTNGNTTLNIIPNGTGTASQFVAHLGSDPANTSRAGININSTQSAALVFSDITGTGTYLPMTFYTSGSERMRLDTSGNLLVGATTNSLSARVKVAGPARTCTFFDLAAPAGENWVIDSTNTTGSTDVLGIYASGATGLYIKDTGDVGIGTTSPAAKLDIGSGNLTFSSTGQRITGDMSNATIANRLAFQSSVTNGNTVLGFLPNGTGTTSALQINNNSDTTAALGFGNLQVSTTEFQIAAAIRNAGTYLPLTFYTGGSERMRLTTAGDLGLGTASPTNKLHLYGDDQTLRIEQNPGLAGNSLIYADAAGGSNYAGIRLSGGWMAVRTDYGDEIQFGPDATRANARMLINVTTGNVGIGGTADASAKVNVLGTLPTSGTNTNVFWAAGTIPSGSTGDVTIFRSNPSTAAASFTASSLTHFWANQGTIGAGSAVTNQYGFLAPAGLTGATNNYGFFSNIASGSNRWNFYAAGTAQNYFAGDVGIGRTPAASTRLSVKAQSNGSGTFSVYVENTTPTEIFKIRDDGTFFTGLAGNSPYNLTTGSAADVVVESSGILRRSTSSLRYKSDVTNATHGLDDVLKLRSVTYKGKNDGDKVFGGLIAEEVHEAGLTEFVKYDKEGRPDALHYGNMVALLVKAMQEQQTIIEQLKADVAALKGA